MIVWLYILLGFFLLILGSEFMIKSSTKIASHFGLSPTVIGLTIVAFGTSAPELGVSIISTVEGKFDVAVANVVGSNIFNICFILGVCSFTRALLFEPRLLKKDAPIMLAASVYLWCISSDKIIQFWESLTLVLFFTIYTSWLLTQSVKNNDDVARIKINGIELFFSIFICLIGLAALVVGGDILVDSSVKLAKSLGLSDKVIGLTIVAAGTSLPELAASINATLRNQLDIAVGNVIGSNIFNILAILGLSGLVVPNKLSVSGQMLSFDIPVMIMTSFLILPLLFTGSRLSRREGLVLLSGYVVYYIVLLSAS